MATVEEYRVFIACPGDLADERSAVIDAVAEINATHGSPLGYRLRPVWYGQDAAAGLGQPQAVVNDFVLGEYELFVGLMWRRFGTPTQEYGSGTEEEYRLARKRCEQTPFPLLFYFLRKPFMPATADDLAELGKVLSFRAELQSSQFTWDCSDLTNFRDRVRKDLCLWMNRLRGTGSTARQEANLNDVGEFRRLWDRMDSSLQQAFAVAYNENRRVGDGGVQTRDLFSALLRVAPESLAPITRHIPAQALPLPTAGSVATEPYVAKESPWLSHCVSSAIRRLAAALPAGRKLTAADIFAEIALNGSGESVRLLREHKVTPDVIERIISTEGLDLVATRG